MIGDGGGYSGWGGSTGVKLTDCDKSSGIKNCNPQMNLDGVNYFGVISFSFDHKMKIPADYQSWGGTNSYFEDSQQVGPIELSVSPGTNQNTSKLHL